MAGQGACWDSGELSYPLDGLTDDHRARLCRYAPDPKLEKSDLPEAPEPVARIVDPEKPVDGEFVFETLSNYETGAFGKEILKLSQLVIGI